MRASVLGFLLSAAAAGLAATPAAAEDNFAFRARPSGLDALGRAATTKLPRTIELPALEREVYDCADTTDDVVAHATDGVLEIDITSLYLGIRDGVVHVDALADVAASAHLDVEQGDLCEGDLSCEVAGSISPLRVGLQLALGMSEDGGIELHRADASIDITEDAFEIDVEGCALGEKLEGAVEAVEGWLLERLTPRLEQAASDLVTERARGAIADNLPLRLGGDALSVQAWLNHVDLDSRTGVTASGEVILHAGGGAPPAPEPSAESPIGEAFPDDAMPGHIAVAVTDTLVNEVLIQAWRIGLLETELAELTRRVELSEAGLSEKLGLPPETRVRVRLDFGEAPRVTFGASGEAMRLEMRALTIELGILPPGEAPSGVEITTDAAAEMEPSIDGETGAMILEPRELIMDRVDVEASGSSLEVDPERLDRFVRDVGVELLTDKLRSTPIAPAFGPKEGVYARVRSVAASDGWLRVGADLGVADPSDTDAPETDLGATPRFVAPGFADVPVSGYDDRTPGHMLRFTATLDGRPLSDKPTMGHEIAVSVADGQHVLEVAAVDLSGNVDPTPARRELVVDGVAPTLEVTREPKKVVQGDLVAEWRAHDDRSAVETHWQLRRLDGDDTVGTVVREGSAGPEGELRVGGLDPSSLYVLRLVAEDEAGNATSEEYGVTIGQGGCSAAGNGGSGAPWALLGMALLLVAIRRRRDVARLRMARRGLAGAPAAALAAAALAAASLALVPQARAQSIGTTLSGPTDADGASSHWNPAAMLRGEGTRIDVGAGVNMIRLDYERPNGDRSETFIPKPEPSLGAYTDALGEDWRLGISAGIPDAAGAAWPRGGEAADVTRYYAVEARNYHMAITPSLAYRPAPWLALGAGVRIVHSRLSAKLDKDMGARLNQQLGSPDPDAPFPYGHPMLAAPLSLEASGWGVGAVGGVLLQPHDRLTLGASVHSPSTSHAKGSIEVEYPDAMRRFVADAAPSAELPEIAGKLETELEMPLMLFTAVAVEPMDAFEVRLDYSFVDRSKVSNTELRITETDSSNLEDTSILRGYRDRHSVGLRFTREWLEGRLVTGLLVRWENDSVPERTASPSNLDFTKYQLGIVGSVAITEQVALTLEYSKYFLRSRRVDTSLIRPLGEPSLDSWNRPSPLGSYGGTSDRVGLALSLSL